MYLTNSNLLNVWFYNSLLHYILLHASPNQQKLKPLQFQGDFKLIVIEKKAIKALIILVKTNKFNIRQIKQQLKWKLFIWMKDIAEIKLALDF